MTSSRRIVTFSLLMLCAVLSLSGTDLILPAVPALPDIFATDEATAQFVLAAYAGGTGLGLLLFGRLADRFERKSLLLASLALFAATSMACAFAPSIQVLIALRLVQGAASAAAPVFGPGIIRQLFSDEVAVRAVGLLGSVESLVPALAPILGVYLLAHFGWRSSFELVGTMAILVALMVLILDLPLQEQAEDAKGTYWHLLGDRIFMRYALTQALTLGGLVAFTFGAPVVIATTMGGTLDSFIIMQVCSVAGFIVAANLTARVAERFGTEPVILFGTAMGAVSALVILAYALAGGRNPFWLPVLFLPMGVGLGLRGPLGFYRGVVAAGNNNARGAALIVFFILMVTTLGTAAVAPVISMGLPALALVVSAIHLLSVGLLLGLPAMTDA